MLRKRFPQVGQLGDIRSITKVELQRKVDQARPDKVLLCGGTKCNQLARCNLERRREGVYGSDSDIFFEFARLVTVLVEPACENNTWILMWFCENKASMQAKFLIIIMRALKSADPRARLPVSYESAELRWARRLRIYIMNADATVVPGEWCGWMGDTVVLSLPPRLRRLPLLSDILRGEYQPALLHRSACQNFPGDRFSLHRAGVTRATCRGARRPCRKREGS